MSTLGNIILIIAGLVVAYSILSTLIDSKNNKWGFPKIARWGVFVFAGLMTLAESLLLASFLGHDFSLYYVASYSDCQTPMVYLITGIWAGNGPSIMFWAWILSVAGAVLLWRSNKSNQPLMPLALSVILTAGLVLLVLLFIDSPFQSLTPIPADGLGLKLLLQTPLMAFHPPTLLAGYALTVVPFALAVSALISHKMDDAWIVTARRWLLAAWLLLGIGNILGMWWAYAELGWGGYWAWDPVENAGLMPWLLLTALLHSSMMYLRHGSHKIWTVLLAVFPFWLVIFGAMLTRSLPDGKSVHTFGETSISLVLLLFLIIILCGVIWLLLVRQKDLEGDSTKRKLITGHNIFTLFNSLIVVSTLVIFIGTMFAYTNVDTNQGYFNIANLPLYVLAIFLSGMIGIVGWRGLGVRELVRKLLWPILIGALVVIGAIVVGWKHWYVLLPLFILGVTLPLIIYKWGRDVVMRWKTNQEKESILASFWILLKTNHSRYGGYIIHIAMVIFAFGIIGSSAFKMHEDKKIVSAGDSIELGGYQFTFQGLEYDYKLYSDYEMRCVVVAKVDLQRDGVLLNTMVPTTTWNLTKDWLQIGSAVAIVSNPFQDFYVVFEDFDGETEDALLSFMINPCVQWIWIGGLLLLLGGLLSFSAPLRKSLPDDS
ncbi:MAG: cytochrome c biogenesis protein CcsA [Dehalococcoidia bacterium]|nr:cytochrome c biogenesis protein CcsA [Dehalococcoidia bacterium]